jgi:hypothetical protein
MADSAWPAKLGERATMRRTWKWLCVTTHKLDPFELVAELEANDHVVRVHIRHEIPQELSLIAGDLLHNARSALDLLITSAAHEFALKSGRELSPADERPCSSR